MGALDGIAVLELAQGIAGPFCGQQLGDAGARVIKWEPPEGDRTRSLGPGGDGAGALFVSLNRNKESLCLNIRERDGLELLRRLAARVDVVVAHWTSGEAIPEGLDYQTLSAGNPRLVYCSLDDFGPAGPLRECVGSELSVQAMAGLHHYLGRHGDEPVRLGPDLASMASGVFAAQAVVAALLHRAQSGRGQHVSVSLLGALVAIKSILWAARTGPDRWEGYHVTGPTWQPETGWQTADLPVTLEFMGDRSDWERFCERVGLGDLPQAFKGEAWRATQGLGDRCQELRSLYEAIFKQWKAEDLSTLARECGAISVPLYDYASVLAHPQVAAIDAVRQIDRPRSDRISVVNPPLALSETPNEVRLSPPRLGEHTASIIAREGLQTEGQRIGRATMEASRPHADGPPGNGPLSGIKVLELTAGGVGPWAATILGEMGADVIKIEPARDFILEVLPKRNGVGTTYLAFNPGKRSAKLNAKDAGDFRVLRDLAAFADVIIENFRPGVLDRLGLGYEEVARANPRIIYCSSSGYGYAGPCAGWPCTDPHMQAFCGYTTATGGRGGPGERLRYFASIDMFTAAVLALGAVLGLYARQRTGRGQRVRTSMLASALALQSTRLAEQFSGAPPVPMGSGHSAVVPDQAFRAADGWVAVTADSEARWRAFCAAVGRSDLLTEPRFQTNARRVENRQGLIAILAAEFKRKPCGWWFTVLQRHGVPSGLFLTDEMVVCHRQTRENEMIVEIEMPGAGRLNLGGLPWRFSETPGRLAPAPIYAGDTEQIRSGVGFPSGR